MKRAAITLIDAMDDAALFKAWFKRADTWNTWRVVLKALFALRMTPKEVLIYTTLTGRATPPIIPAREAWLIAGRRGGKSFIAALIGVFLACFQDYRQFLSPGERGTIMILSNDRRQSRVIMRYTKALLEGVPMLKRMVERIGAESIDLTNSITIEIHTSSYRSVRGYSVCACLCDEIGYWRSEDSANPDVEILDAIRPAMATIPNALLLCLSSPYARRGALWDAYQNHYGRDGRVQVFQAETLTLNPTVPQEVIDAAYADDPIAASAEYGAQFRSDIEGFLQPEWIDSAVREGLHEIQPLAGVSYKAFTDPSGGAHDAFTLAISHREGDRLILDVCRGVRPPFDPSQVVAEFAAILKRYGCFTVQGDRYAAEWVVSAFQKSGIFYQPSERSKSEIYIEAVPEFACNAIQLLDIRTLLNELRQLERRTARGGRDSVDHPPRGHDDLANACCGALVLIAGKNVPVDVANGSYVPDERERAAALDVRLREIGTNAGLPSPWDGGSRDSPWDY